jgi:hypothetical protein
MKKFDIKPYIHNVEVRVIYMAGKMYGPEILLINDEYLKGKVLLGLTKVACFSLSTGVPTKASAPHTVMTALNNLLALKNLTGIDVPALKGASAGAPAAEVVVVSPAKDAGKGKDAGKDAGKGKKKEPEPEGNFN